MGRSRIRKKQISSDSDSDDGTAPQKSKRSKPSTQFDAEEDPPASTSSGRCWVRRSSNFYSDSDEHPSYGLNANGIFSRCGKIMAIRLKNFMCHSNLYIEFGPFINFLVGSNGSGKSAVITALALGLAGSARSTSRASSIQKLIKNGETAATIELTLCNTGLRPFRPQTYGPQITVVRHIRQSSSTYELKDAKKRSVSKKLEEIRRMLLFFGISVENPIFVLNQEASREFLKDLEPESNYKLLMKATQLDLCAVSLSQCHEERKRYSFDLDMLQLKSDKLKHMCQEEEEKLVVIKNKEAIKNRLKEASTMLAWLQVTRIQDELTKVEHSLKIIEKKNTDLSQKTTQKNETQDTFQQQLQKCMETKQQIQERYQTQDAKLRQAKGIVQDCLYKFSSIRAGIKNVEKRLKEEQTTYEGCEKHMNNYHDDYTEVKRLKEHNNATLAMLKENVEESKLVISRLRDEQNDIKNRIPARKERVEFVRTELSNLQRSQQNLQFEMESLLRNKSNKMSVYGENAMKVALALKTQYSGNNDHLMPRGPIGMYITVPNPKYRDLIENQLGNCLRSYIVSTDKERISLRALLQKSYSGTPPTIIRSAFTSRVYNVSKYRVQTRAPNTTVLMDEIRCDDPVVMNYLIDTMRIETVLVTDSKETAEFLTSNTENVPPNLTRILVPNLGLEYCPSPNYAVYSIKISAARYIQVNVDDRIKQLKAEQDSLQERGAIVQPQYAEAKRILDIDLQEINKKKASIDAHHSENTKAMQKIMDIENFEYRELPALDVLETHLNSSREKMKKCIKEREQLEQQIRDINEHKSQADEKVRCEQSALDAINKKASDIETETQELQNKMRDLDRNFEENKRRYKQTSELMQSILKSKRELEKDLEKARLEAQKVGEFIETSKSEEKIREKISNYKAKINHFESMNIVSEEVEKKLSSLRQNFKTHNDNLNHILNIVEKLRMDYHTRAQRFQRSRFHFLPWFSFNLRQQALYCRQFDGDMEANHREKKLNISVYPPSGNKTSNTRSLSGGERSFTTVSLLKGLWSTSDHPFYFLDEYDVFTDEVNRTFITKLLIQEGIDFQNRQYCFLTPQDTKVDANHLITIHKLEAPEH